MIFCLVLGNDSTYLVSRFLGCSAKAIGCRAMSSFFTPTGLIETNQFLRKVVSYRLDLYSFMNMKYYKLNVQIPNTRSLQQN